MRRILPIGMLAALAASLAIPAASRAQQADAAAASAGTAQQASGAATQSDSIAEAARRAREAKKEQPKPARVFDNDNLPGGTISTVGKAEEPKKDGDASADTSADTKKSGSNAEKDWKEKFARLRAKEEHDKQDLEVLQRELGVLNIQNYSDPVKTMQQGVTRSDINNKVAAIDAKQKAIEADEQAITDAEDELRKTGGDSGWAR
jgi:hypothetical protein